MAIVSIIEPDRLLARIFAEYLTMQGHEVGIHTSGQAAMYAAEDKTPDIIVLELQLAGQSGIEFLYEFRSYTDWMPIPVIVQTNVQPYIVSRQLVALRELGIVKVLYKPETSLLDMERAIRMSLEVSEPYVIPMNLSVVPEVI